jgi:hypothetical protein
VRDVLLGMLAQTYSSLGETESLRYFDISQDYTASQGAKLRIDDPIADELRRLFEHDNAVPNAQIMRTPHAIWCYYAIFFDNNHRKTVLALKKANQFKVVSQVRNRLTLQVNDMLTVLNEPVFKFDVDFDLVVSEQDILVLRPNLLKHIINIASYVKTTSILAAETLATDLPTFNLTSMRAAVESKTRVATLLTALVRRGDIARMSDDLIVEACKRCKVVLSKDDKDGRYVLKPGDELNFLKTLDRRRYTSSLIPGEDEVWEAANRHKAT